jgi:serine/threonine-protein kinase
MRFAMKITRPGPAALFAVLLATAAPAWADGPTDQAAGSALFQEAKQLVAAGDFAQACPKFAEAQRLFPTTGTLLNLGNCYEKLGKLASAWGTFKEAEVMARNQNDADREREASRRAEALSAQRAKLAVNVPPAVRVPGFELRRDGTLLGEGQWGSALPVDTGTHTFEAKAPGRKTWSTWVRVDTNGSSSTIEVPVLEVAAAEPDRTAPFWNGQRTAGAVLGGVGLVGMITGAVFAARAAGKNSDSLPHCLTSDITKCDATGVALRDDAFGAAHVSTGTFVAGGVLTAVGIVVFATASRSSSNRPEASAHLTIAPAVGPGVAGFALQGVW